MTGRIRIAVRLAGVTFVVSVLVVSCHNLHATDYFWAAGENGLFNDPTKWGPVGVPDGDDTAIFDRGLVAYTVTFPGGSVLDPPPNYVINYLRVHTNEVTFADNSSPFVTSPSLTVANPDVSIVVGQDAGEVGILNTTLLSLSGANASIGRAAGAHGTLNVIGGTFSLSGELDVGTGNLNISGTGSVSSASANVGYLSGSSGTVTVGGSGSSWTNSGTLVVGGGGNGTLTILDGSSVSSDIGLLGIGSNGTGTVTVSGAGSNWMNNSQLRIGSGALIFSGSIGTLTIEGGGRVSNGLGQIGASYGSTGTAVVTGAGSNWTNSGDLEIGFEGTGTLRIENGGSVSNSSAFVGREDVSNGTVIVEGDGAAWLTNGSLYVAGYPSDSTPDSVSTLTIGPGGSVSVVEDVVLFPNGVVRLQGGTLDAAAIFFDKGQDVQQFHWTSGTLHVGSFTGTLLNEGGTLAPGRSIGSTTITGYYIQFPDAALEIEIGPPDEVQHDTVNVSASALVHGELKLALINNFIPDVQETFSIFTADSLSGAFSNVANGQRITTTDGVGSFLVNYGEGSAFNPNQVVLSSFVLAALTGDMDCDGDVDFDDIDDFVLGLNNPEEYENQIGVPPETKGDTDGDGDMDFDDIDDFVSILTSSNLLVALSVPEPVTAMLMCLAMGAFAVSGGLARPRRNQRPSCPF
jgi:T5SS/PEP-CTERM-associated repeat protein